MDGLESVITFVFQTIGPQENELSHEHIDKVWEIYTAVLEKGSPSAVFKNSNLMDSIRLKIFELLGQAQKLNSSLLIHFLTLSKTSQS